MTTYDELEIQRYNIDNTKCYISKALDYMSKEQLDKVVKLLQELINSKGEN